MSGPLSGIKIIEFSQIIAAPFAGSMLSDMGAEIIKIEPPSGDPWRYALEIIPGVPAFGRSFFALNRGKKGITLVQCRAFFPLFLSLKLDQGRELYQEI